MPDGPPGFALPAAPSRGSGESGPPDYFNMSVASEHRDLTASPERAEPVVPPDHPWAAMLAPPSVGGGGGGGGGVPSLGMMPRSPLEMPRTPGIPRAPAHDLAESAAPKSSAPLLSVPGLGAPPAARRAPAPEVPAISLAVPGPSDAGTRSSSAPASAAPSLVLPDEPGASRTPPTLRLPKDLPGLRRSALRTPSPQPEVESGRIHSLEPAELLSKLRAHESVLLVDIRPATAFSRGHIRGCINLCAPSTLLKRKEFTVDRLETQMLDDGEERERFGTWRTHSPDSWIVALDTDATSTTSVGRSTSGGGGACLVGLLCKFDQERYAGHLGWLHGGFAAFQSLPEAREYVVREAPTATRSASHPTSPGIVRPRGLSLDAFRLPMADAQAPAQATNPFFDNNRQNLELACGITDVVPLEVGELSDTQKARLPAFLQALLAMPSKQRADHLAQLFFQIEKSEQERLRGVMQRHTHESSGARHGGGALLSARAANPHTPTEREVPEDAPFPLSITAGLERGMDNRYRNLWTFEHSRVKLGTPLDPRDPGSNYLNASYLNPLRHRGCHRVYIATQAPLPVTFLAFWEALWEQGCSVILMLAREFEAGRLQCHNYWEFASPRLTVHVERQETLTRAGLGLAGDAPVAVRRTLRVERGGASRTFVQLQYLGWPDHSVPSSADELLALMAMANTARGTDGGPLVVHCSAGIGRTGAQITIDVVLHYLRLAKQLADAPDGSARAAAARDAWSGSTDLIYEALSVMREQRMSVVQTVRQYVFTYHAVIEALAGSCT